MSRASIAVLAMLSLGLAGCAGGGDDSAELLNTQEMQPNESAPSPAQARPTSPRSSAPAPKPRSVTLPQGTALAVRMTGSLNSGTSKIGDRFQAEVLSPVSVNGEVVVPAGSVAGGSVTDVKSAKRGAGHGSLTLQFDRLELPDGPRVKIAASLSQETEGKKKRNAAIIGGSAAGGAILGRVLGDDSKDAAVGALVGGAIGTGVVLSKEGDQVEMPAGTELTIALDAPVQMTLPPKIS
jgi:outer membrane lipoprotein SlyB